MTKHRMIAPGPTLRGLALALLLAGCSPAAAQDWDPFRERDAKVKLQRERPPGGADAAARTDRRDDPLPMADSQFARPWGAGNGEVERGDLQPVLAGDGSGLPLELWQDLDIQTVEEHVAGLGRTVPSPALQDVWKRVWMSNAPPPAGGRSAGHFLALRIEALYRVGQLDELKRLLARPSQNEGALVATLEARLLIGLGDRQRGCDRARHSLRQTGELPKPVRAEAILVSGYCAAAAGDSAAAGLAAEIAHEQQSEPSLALAVLDALASGSKPKLEMPQRVSLLDYRFLELGGLAHPGQVLDRAEPALLVALALDTALDPATRVAAAEAASRISAIDAATLADAYRAVPSQTAELANAGRPRGEAFLQRALLFRAAEVERVPSAKARLLHKLLAEGRRAGLAFQTAAIAGSAIEDMQPAPDVGWFAETAVESLLAAGDYAQARSWAEAAAGPERDSGLMHWLAAIDLADPGVAAPHSRSLAYLEPLAAGGRLPPEALHRIVTVFDALDFQIPIELWQLASRTPQPTTGHLPDTGVLSRLQDAAGKKAVARVLLLSLETLGPDGAPGAHMIALGDTLKALKRAGLEADARRLGLEAVFALWPRTASN